MTKFVKVSLYRSGRVLTQYYPARSVGEKREPYDVDWDCHQLIGESWAECVDDMRCCAGCGYAVCSCPTEPPADVLPEGWIGEPNMPAHLTVAYFHTSGAWVQLSGGGAWAWYPPAGTYGARCYTPKATRDEAMAAAVASVGVQTPDEPPADEPYGCVNRTTDSPRECVESGHYWCDAFKSKPARGEP
jgi:hypothetical protein